METELVAGLVVPPNQEADLWRLLPAEEALKSAVLRIPAFLPLFRLKDYPPFETFHRAKQVVFPGVSVYVSSLLPAPPFVVAFGVALSALGAYENKSREFFIDYLHGDEPSVKCEKDGFRRFVVGLSRPSLSARTSNAEVSASGQVFLRAPLLALFRFEIKWEGPNRFVVWDEVLSHRVKKAASPRRKESLL